jgi:hypothetical protein
MFIRMILTAAVALLLTPAAAPADVRLSSGFGHFVNGTDPHAWLVKATTEVEPSFIGEGEQTQIRVSSTVAIEYDYEANPSDWDCESGHDVWSHPPRTTIGLVRAPGGLTQFHQRSDPPWWIDVEAAGTYVEDNTTTCHTPRRGHKVDRHTIEATIPSHAAAQLEPGCYHVGLYNSQNWVNGMPEPGGTVAALAVGISMKTCAPTRKLIVTHLDENAVPIPAGAEPRGRVSTEALDIDCGEDCEQEFALGLETELTAAPKPGWRFDRWTGGCAHAGTNPECRITMDADKAVGAVFVRDKCTAGHFEPVFGARIVLAALPDAELFRWKPNVFYCYGPGYQPRISSAYQQGEVDSGLFDGDTKTLGLFGFKPRYDMTGETIFPPSPPNQISVLAGNFQMQWSPIYYLDKFGIKSKVGDYFKKTAAKKLTKHIKQYGNNEALVPVVRKYVLVATGKIHAMTLKAINKVPNESVRVFLREKVIDGWLGPKLDGINLRSQAVFSQEHLAELSGDEIAGTMFDFFFEQLDEAAKLDVTVWRPQIDVTVAADGTVSYSLAQTPLWHPLLTIEPLRGDPSAAAAGLAAATGMFAKALGRANPAAAARKGKIALGSYTAPAAGTLTANLTAATAVTAARRAKPAPIAKVTRRFTGAGSARVTLKVTRSGARKLRRLRRPLRVTLAVAFKDTTGRETGRVRTVKLKPRRR